MAMVALLLGLGTLLTACAGKEPAPETPALTRDCLWVLWIKDPAQAQDAAAQIAKGRNLTLVAREYVRQGPEKATLDTGCPSLAELPLGVVEAAKPLALGQVSPGLPMRGGTAFVMRGSDRYRLASQAHYAQKRYKEAQEAALQDLALNPASSASWLLLGQSRAAAGDLAGAHKAFDTGLLIDPRNAELQQAKRLPGQAPASPAAGAPVATKPASPAEQPTPPAGPAAATGQSLTLGAPPEVPNEDVLEARQLLESAKHAHKETRDPAKAEQLALKATKLDPKSAPAWLLLAQLQEAKGQYAEATMSYHQAASLDPAQEEANTGLRRSFLALDKERVARLGAGAASPPPIPRDTLPDAPKRVIPRGTLPDAPTQAGKWDHYFQVASVKNLGEAQQEARNWTRRGHHTKVWAWQGPDGSTWQRVLVGPYPTREQARAAAQKLKDQGSLSYFSLVEFPRR